MRSKEGTKMLTANDFFSLPPRYRTKERLELLLACVRDEAAAFALRMARKDINQHGTAEQAVGVIDAHISDPVPMEAHS